MSTVNKKDERNRINGKLTIIVMVFTFLLIVSLVLLYFVSKKEASLAGADTQIRLSAQGGFECEYSEAQKLYPYGEGVLKVTSERIAYLTLSGNEIYSSVVSYRNPQCFVNSDFAVVYDLDGYSFSVLNKDNIIYTMPTANQIKAVNISNTGIVAVITNSSNSYGEVNLYDVTGNILSEWSSYNSGYPLSCSFNNDSTLFAITTINTTGAVVVPYVRVFSLVSGNKGIEVSDNAVYTTDDAVVMASCFYADKSLYTFTADRIYKVTNDTIDALDKDFASINYVTLVGNRIYIIYSDGVNQLNKIAVMDSSNRLIYDSDLGSNVKAVTSNGSLYAVSVDSRIFVFDNSGNIIGDLSVDEDILRMSFISGNQLCVVSTGGVHTVDY